MKIRSKHNDLLNYFMRPHEDLPAAYLRSCEKFFRELGKKRNKFQASSSTDQGPSFKLQAASLKKDTMN